MADAAGYVAQRMAGRCRSGWEADGGRLYHAVAAADHRDGWARALCSVRPGYRGNGWSETPGDRVTCPRCQARLAKLQAEAPRG